MNEIITVRDPDVIAAEINEVKHQVQEVVIYASIKIGGKLMEAKSLVNYGEWGKWLSENVGYSQSTANYLMQLYQEYGTNQESLFDTWTKSQTFAKLSFSKHIALLALPFGERQEFAEQNDAENMSTRQLQQAIKERDEAQKALAESEEKLSDAYIAIKEVKQEKVQATSTLESENKALQDKVEKAQKAQSAAEADLKKVKKKLADAEAAAKKSAEDAKKAAENPEIPESAMEQMRAEIAAEEAKKAADNLQKELAEAQKNVDAANRAREEAERKLADKQKESTMANPDVAVFKSLVQQVQSDFTRMQDVRKKIQMTDEALGANLAQVIRQLLDKLREEI